MNHSCTIRLFFNNYNIIFSLIFQGFYIKNICEYLEKLLLFLHIYARYTKNTELSNTIKFFFNFFYLFIISAVLLIILKILIFYICYKIYSGYKYYQLKYLNLFSIPSSDIPIPLYSPLL